MMSTCFFRKRKYMPAQMPFRFGVASGPYAKTSKEWISKVCLAEDLGYDSFLVPDHFWLDVAPITALMAAAAATTSIRIGSHVFGNDFRSPAVLAKEVATLDMFSEGRFQLGLGCGYDLRDYQQAGIAFDEPKVRVDRFKEALFIIKHYFTDDVVNFSGKYYTVTNLKGSVTHVQKPHPPIYIGGSGKRMFTIAGREADIVGVGGGTIRTVEERLNWLKEAAGPRIDHLELAVTIFLIGVTSNDWRKVPTLSLPAHLQHILGLGPEIAVEKARERIDMLVGTEDQIVETLLDRRERLGISYIQVTGEHFEAFAPVVARLAGR
jgi:probable F420-dependent oxidoreductase